MKLLVVLLIGTMMVLTRAFPEPEAFPEAFPEPGEDDEPEIPENQTGDEANETSSEAVLQRSARSSCRYRDNTWYRYGDSIYVFVARAVNWVTAQRICVGVGGSLVSLRNSREEAFVKTLAKNRIAWIGLSDGQQAGQWLWIGSTRVTYYNWCRGQPSNGSTEKCTVMNVTSQRCWFDNACTPAINFVCSRKVR